MFYDEWFFRRCLPGFSSGGLKASAHWTLWNNDNNSNNEGNVSRSTHVLILFSNLMLLREELGVDLSGRPLAHNVWSPWFKPENKEKKGRERWRERWRDWEEKQWSEGGKNRERRNERGEERKQGRKIFDFLIDFSLSLLSTYTIRVEGVEIISLSFSHVPIYISEHLTCGILQYGK